MNPSDPSPTPQARLRTSDAEREQVATILRAAMAEGRLTLAEGEDRMTAVYAAKFRDELGPLTADLPHGGRQALAETPQARAATRREVGRRLGFLMVLTALLGGLWLLTGAGFFWPIFPLAFLVMRTIKHGAHHHGHHGHRVAPWNAPGHR